MAGDDHKQQIAVLAFISGTRETPTPITRQSNAPENFRTKSKFSYFADRSQEGTFITDSDGILRSFLCENYTFLESLSEVTKKCVLSAFGLPNVDEKYALPLLKILYGKEMEGVLKKSSAVQMVRKTQGEGEQ